MTKEHHYTVRGSWPFPLDMLRHDQSCAATPQDQDKIDRYSMEHAPDREVFQPVEINLVGQYKPNTARWESFTWSVPTDTDYQATKAARTREQERRTLRDSAMAKLTAAEREAVEWYCESSR